MGRDSGLSPNAILIAFLLAIIAGLIIALAGEVVASILGAILFVVLIVKNYVGLKRPTYDSVRFSIELSMVVIFGFLFIYGSNRFLEAFNPAIMHEPLSQLETNFLTSSGYFFLGFIGFLLSAPFIPDMIYKLVDDEWILDRSKYFAWLNTPIE